MDNKKKNWLLFFLIVGILSMTVAFAGFSTRLNINGTAKVSKFSWTIVIDKWQRNNNVTSVVSGSTNTAEEITSPSLTPEGEVTKVSGLEVLFKKPGDRIQYTFDIANKGTIDAELYSWELETPKCTSNGEDVTCKIHREVKCNGLDPTVGSEIKAGESIPCTYTVWYEEENATNGYLMEPMKAEDLGVEFHYVEKGKSSTYVRQIKVQFNTYGGETIEDIINPKGSTITLPTLSKEGYEFAGWTDVENGETAKYTENTITLNKDVTLYPVFIKEGYTITYNLNKGEATNPETYYIDSENITLNNPTKTGYTFAGWSGTDLTGDNNASVTIPSGSTGDRSYEAHYSVVNYTITYNLDNGTTTNPGTYTVTTDDITLSDATKAGYTFTGWTGEGITTPTKNVKIEKGSTGNKTYTANYEIKTYTISYELNKGSATNETSYTVESNNITLNNPTKTITFKGNVNNTGAQVGENTTAEQTFLGWIGSNGNTPSTSVTIEKGSIGNKEYTAKWTSVGGTLPRVSKKGYTCGWSTKEDGSIEYQSEGSYPSTKIEEGSKTTINLYAICTRDTYTISYELNNGSASNNPSSYNVESNTITLNNPTKTITFKGNVNNTGAEVGENTSATQTFLGWIGSNVNTPSTSVTIAKGSTGNKEYTAKWTSVGGTLPKVSKKGYTCGWSTKEDESIEYQSEGSYPSSKIEEGSKTTINLYAICTRDTYTISYELNNGSASNNPSSYNVESNAITLNNPSKNGYKFTGWSGTGLTGNTNTTVTIEKASTGNRSYEAHYTPKSYTISYTLNGGSASNASSYTIESNAITLNNPTKAGYTFTGWSGTDLTGDNNLVVTIPTGSTGNRSYEAHYSVVNYTITYNLDNGTTTNPGTYTVATDDITLSDATKAGYTFLGWTGEGITTPTKNVKIEKGSTGNKTYTANYTPTSYTISYTLNGGSASNETSYTIESNNITLNNPSKNGYTFTGWSGTGLTGENSTSVTIPSGSTGNRSYEAHYTPINYTISYDGNTGTLASNPSTYNIETSTFTLNNPTKTVTVVGNENGSGATIGSNTSAEQTFYGWSGTGLTGTNNTEVSITKGSTGDKSYTANYQSVAVTLPKATKTGYTCYWYDSNGVIMGESEQSWMPSATSETTVNAYASCTVNTYTVSFNKNEGSGGQSSSVNATYGSNMPSISTTAPTRTGYTFGGWYDTSASTGGTQYYTASGASARTYDKASNTTLYARWTYSATPSISRTNHNTFTVSANGGSQYIISTTQTSKPTSSTSGWSTTTSKTTSTTTKETWYVWVKDSSGTVSPNYATITNYKVTLSAGTGTTISAKANTSSGTTISNCNYVLNGTPVFATGALSTGYKSLVVKKNNTTITNGSSQNITSDTTFTSSASIQTFTVSVTASTNITSCSGGGTYNYGSTATITCTKKANSTASSYTYTNGSNYGSYRYKAVTNYAAPSASGLSFSLSSGNTYTAKVTNITGNKSYTVTSSSSSSKTGCQRYLSNIKNISYTNFYGCFSTSGSSCNVTSSDWKTNGTYQTWSKYTGNGPEIPVFDLGGNKNACNFHVNLTSDGTINVASWSNDPALYAYSYKVYISWIYLNGTAGGGTTYTGSGTVSRNSTKNTVITTQRSWQNSSCP